MASCAHCNAPLPPGIAKCKYCGVTNDIDKIGGRPADVPTQPRSCPGCGTIMHTIDIRSGKTLSSQPFWIEKCPHCQGLFFDTDELEELVRRASAKVFARDAARLQALSVAAQDSDQIRYKPCPVCHKLMNREPFVMGSAIIVDRCRNHGIYLDAGELKALLDWVRYGGMLARNEGGGNLSPIKELNLPQTQKVPVLEQILGVLRNFLDD